MGSKVPDTQAVFLNREDSLALIEEMRKDFEARKRMIRRLGAKSTEGVIITPDNKVIGLDESD